MMQMQRWGLSLVLCLGLGLGAIACGDDDSGTNGSSGSGGKSGGTGAKNAGGGAKTGSGSGGKTSTGSGSGGKTGSSGTSGGSGGITADQAAAGACNMMGMGTGNSMCTGVDDYVACATDECMIDDCTKSGGDCADLLDCIKGADDPCNNNCMPSSKCTSCLMTKEQCAVDKCIDKLQCGTRKAGGACDMLEDCCKDMMNSVACSMVNVIVVGGDDSCQSILDFACGSGTGTAGMGGNAGAGAGASDKTCDDLKACCDMLSGMNMMACTQAYDAIKGSGDAACGQVYSSLSSALGCK